MTSSRPRPSTPAARFADARIPSAARRPSASGDGRGAGGARPAGREGARRTVLETIRQIPSYLRLLGGLVVDRRVSLLDKALVAGAIAYIVSPLDLIPDFIPFLGQVDDVFLLMTALERLVANAGRSVVLEHWHGDRAEVDALDFQAVLGAAALFLPGGLRGKLVQLVKGGFRRGRRGPRILRRR